VKRSPSDQEKDFWKSVTRDIVKTPYDGIKPSVSPSYHHTQRQTTWIDDPLGEPYLPKRQDVNSLNRRQTRNINFELTLDLHGCNEEQAEQKLKSFIYQCLAINARTVLIITGKGKNIIKQFVENWLLNHPEVIASYQQAQQKHGGQGAFYVFIKKI
jgi:DNA-nicking Smr family endonuclease